TILHLEAAPAAGQGGRRLPWRRFCRRHCQPRRPARVDTHRNEGWKARHATVRQLLIAKRNERANLRRLLALAIGKARAHVETRSVCELHLQRAQAPLVATSTGNMANHARFRIVKRLYLEQGAAAARLVTALGAARHEAFSAQRLDAR